VRQRILLDATGWFQLEESVPYLPVVQEAVWQNRRLHLSYRRGDNKRIERLIDPYGIVAKTSIWYVVGAAQGNFRTYRVSRILAATLTDEYFERPESFDLAVFWSETCTQFETSRSHFVATLRFAPDVIPFLPYMFGEEVLALIEQAVPPDDDGWITLSLNFEHLDAACNHVLGLGTQVEVLAPQELREQVADCAARIAAFYHNPRQDSPGGKPITAVPEAKQGAD
jgi:predicted DNA-binding transcriptional regulator YafY